MRVGFSSIYSWRPHVEHLVFLARLMRSGGHEVRFLTCDADLPACYTRELRPHARTNCLGCRAGGVRSFERRDVSSIRSFDRNIHEEGPLEWAKSSASTIGRFESNADYNSRRYKDLVAKIAPATAIAYSAALSWIEREKLDAICVFNGRMDATRAISEAAKAAGIRFVSLERTWFGDGLQLLPDENCLGLTSVDRMVAEWRDLPLLLNQATKAAGHVASRFLHSNVKEWQAYNIGATNLRWPANGDRRVLILPSSRNEFYGHPDWESAWPEVTAAYDALIDRLSLRPEDIVLRCHPNWALYIGQNDGSLSTNYYREWAKRRGVTFIEPSAPANTLDLIDQAEIIVVGGTSAGLEAGILGKQVVAIAPSTYQAAGFQIPAYSQEEVDRLRLPSDPGEPDRVARLTLRYAYSMFYRLPQYVRFVRSLTTTRYLYRSGADPDRFADLCKDGVLRPDDSSFASNHADEDAVLALIKRGQWKEIIDQFRLTEIHDQGEELGRRPFFQAIDRMRNLMPLGHDWHKIAGNR